MTARINSQPLLAILTELAELRTLSLTLGFQGEKGAAIHPMAEVPVATVAMFAEYGTIDAPARSFLRSTMFERRADIAKAFAAELGKVAAGKATALEGMSAVGKATAAMIREKIERARGWATPNKPSTIAKKGHSQPLRGGDANGSYDGGVMLDAVTWAVRKNGSIVAEGT